MLKPSWIKPLTKFKASDRALVIPVIGVEANVGTTHMCIMLGAYLSRQRLKVAIAECNNSGAMTCIEQAYEGSEFDTQQTRTFKIKGVQYYKDVLPADITNICQNAYDIVILDVGQNIALWYEEIVRGDKPLFIGYFNDWKRDKTMDFVVRYSDLMGARSKLLLRNGDKNLLKEAKKATGCRTYPVPHWEDPFVKTTGDTEILQKIVEE